MNQTGIFLIVDYFLFINRLSITAQKLVWYTVNIHQFKKKSPKH